MNEKAIDYRLLVVDDEPALRRLMVMAFSKQGFACDHAENGQDALQHLASSQYDAVISDLAMPVMHGHALAPQILVRPDRPLLVIVTGVLEPRLARDLLDRGVDDIVFKPVDFQALALKLKVLLDRRNASQRRTEQRRKLATPKTVKPYDLNGLKPIDSEELDRQLTDVACLVPISTAALDVYQLATSSDASISTLSAALERDGALIAETLRMANGAQLNQSARRIVTVEDALLRLGTARVAELALSVSALSAMTPERIPWMDIDLEWRRSIASGVAVEFLLEQTSIDVTGEGLFLSVILHGMGRYILASLYPQHYEVLLAQCAQRNSTLDEAERQVFPLDHTAVLARLLEQWKISPEVYRPLAYLSTEFADLSSVPERVRPQVELIKLAIVLGQVSQGSWRSWDSINHVDQALLAKWGVDDLELLLERIRTQTTEIIAFRRGRVPTEEVFPAPTLMPYLPYWCKSQAERDLMLSTLTSAGFLVESLQEHQLSRQTGVLVNGLDGMPGSVNKSSLANSGHRLLVSVRDTSQRSSEMTNPLILPCSVSAMRNACLQLLPPITTPSPILASSPSLSFYA